MKRKSLLHIKLLWLLFRGFDSLPFSSCIYAAQLCEIVRKIAWRKLQADWTRKKESREGSREWEVEASCCQEGVWTDDKDHHREWGC